MCPEPPCFAVIGDFGPRHLFNPVELFEELQRLFRRPPAFLSRLQRLDKAPPGMGHAAKMPCPLQRAPSGIAITHHDAAVIAEKGLWVYLAAARLIIEQHDRFGTVFTAAIGPHVRGAGGLPILFLQHLNRRLVAMDDGLRSKPQFQRVIDAVQMPFACADHPMAQSPPADRNTGAPEGQRQAVEWCAVDIFVNEREG